jgi:hypothetical protein
MKTKLPSTEFGCKTGHTTGFLARMPYFALVLIAALVFAGCVTRPIAKEKIGIKLTAEQFVDRTFTLISETEAERYRFDKNGTVMATVGSMGNPIELKGATWEIIEARRLVITGAPEQRVTITLIYQFDSIGKSQALTTGGKKYRIE